MNFILILGLVYLYLKYRDVSKELLILDSRLENLEIDYEETFNDMGGEYVE